MSGLWSLINGPRILSIHMWTELPTDFRIRIQKASVFSEKGCSPHLKQQASLARQKQDGTGTRRKEE